ncbi:hypothetical protein ACQY0O_000843 [Thecaphora frezii]
MLVQRYGTVREDERTSPARGTKVRATKPPKSSSSDSYARKSMKVNAVSKASLAMLDPRHAMGIDVGLEWHESPTLAYKTRMSIELERNASASSSAGADGEAPAEMGSPTPTLEAFATSIEDITAAVSSYDGTTDRSASDSSFFEDDRETDGRSGYGAQRNPTTSRGKPKLELESPARNGKPSKGNRGGNSGSTLSRFFTWKKKDKPAAFSSMGGSRSASDLYDAAIPQSAPPTTTSFDIHHHVPLVPARSISEDDYSYRYPHIADTADTAEWQQDGLPREYGSQGSLCQAAPSLRDVRAAAFGDEGSTCRAEYGQKLQEAIPSLPPLAANIATSSPMMPDICNRWGIYSPEQDAAPYASPPASGIAIGAMGRSVSTVGRGVPGRDRKSTIILKSEAQVRRELTSRAPPLPMMNVQKHPVVHAGGSHARRTSMAKHVVEGLLDQNHGREEPALPSQVDANLGVRAGRRRSRSVDIRAPPLLASFDLASTAIAEAETAEVGFKTATFPAPDRVAARRPRKSGGRQASEADGAAPVSWPARRVPVGPAMPQTDAATELGSETHQARRVNITNQRARAVAVASPSLIQRSPRAAPPPPVVNVMPPSPDPESLAGIEIVAVHDAPVGLIQTDVSSSSAVIESVSIGNPVSICSPQSVLEEARFSCAYGGLGDAMNKGTMEVIEILAELPGMGRVRSHSMASELSELSSSGSSTSGAFGFSDSLSSSSLVSGGSFSSISSYLSESSDCSGKASFARDGVPPLPEIVISRSASLQSLADVAKADDGAQLEDEIATAGPREQLRTPFHFQAGGRSYDESDDCETPTLASCREISAFAPSSSSPGETRRLDLDMDLNELAQELGLGRLSRILPPSTAAAAAEPFNGKTSHSKPSESQARNVSQWRRSITSDAYDTTSVHSSLTATSPLSFPVAVRSPRTPRTTLHQTAAGAKLRQDVAGNVPTTPGGMGLGLDFGTAEPSCYEQQQRHYHGHVRRAGGYEHVEWNMGFAL